MSLWHRLSASLLHPHRSAQASAGAPVAGTPSASSAPPSSSGPTLLEQHAAAPGDRSRLTNAEKLRVLGRGFDGYGVNLRERAQLIDQIVAAFDAKQASN